MSTAVTLRVLLLRRPLRYSTAQFGTPVTETQDYLGSVFLWFTFMLDDRYPKQKS
jgi:hypothetical protein